LARPVYYRPITLLHEIIQESSLTFRAMLANSNVNS